MGWHALPDLDDFGELGLRKEMLRNFLRARQDLTIIRVIYENHLHFVACRGCGYSAIPPEHRVDGDGRGDMRATKSHMYRFSS